MQIKCISLGALFQKQQLGWGYKTNNWPIDSAIAKFTTFWYTFPINFFPTLKFAFRGTLGRYPLRKYKKVKPFRHPLNQGLGLPLTSKFGKNPSARACLELLLWDFKAFQETWDREGVRRCFWSWGFFSIETLLCLHPSPCDHKAPHMFTLSTQPFYFES